MGFVGSGSLFKLLSPFNPVTFTFSIAACTKEQPEKGSQKAKKAVRNVLLSFFLLDDSSFKTISSLSPTLRKLRPGFHKPQSKDLRDGLRVAMEHGRFQVSGS
jgi:hypothetical protein